MDRAQLISFLQQKGFIWGPSPEVYGGLAGFYTYAPLGKLLKNKVEAAIRHFFQSHQFWEVECPSIMQTKVWEASGHLQGFTDNMVICTKCASSFKIEALLDELFPDKNITDYEGFFKKTDMPCPNCATPLPHTLAQHDLMMKTSLGLDTEAYLRPETATTTYLPFVRYVDFFRKKFPFGVFQIGKAYRNEISPRQHILRMREFTQAEAQLVLFPEQKQVYDSGSEENLVLPLWPNTKKKIEPLTIKEALKKKYIKNKAYASTMGLAYQLFRTFGFKKDQLRIKQHSKEEMAFYADDAWDLEVKTESFGWIECCGIHDRTDYDLKRHEHFSGKSFAAQTEEYPKQRPHILEIAFGVDRPVFCLFDTFVDIRSKKEGKTVFRVPPPFSPITVAVFPLVNKDKLPQISQDIYHELNKYYTCVYDAAGSVGKRYLREAEKGTALCVTVDFETVEKGTVTLRERDSEKQIRVHREELRQKIQDYLEGVAFTQLGKKV